MANTYKINGFFTRSINKCVVRKLTLNQDLLGCEATTVDHRDSLHWCFIRDNRCYKSTQEGHLQQGTLHDSKSKRDGCFPSSGISICKNIKAPQGKVCLDHCALGVYMAQVHVYGRGGKGSGEK